MNDTGSGILLDGVKFGWTRRTNILRIDSLAVSAGEAVFVEGPSGTGKSSLLALLAGIAPPKTGRVAIGGTDLYRLTEAKRDAFRAAEIGMIFQQFNLVPYLSILDNVLLPCRFSPVRAKRATARAKDMRRGALTLLDRLGMADLAQSNRPVRKLSVGQQQRVAAARALIGEPTLILADEPTSALDAGNRDNFTSTLLTEAKRTGATVVFVSHDPALAEHFDRRLHLAEINQNAGEVV